MYNASARENQLAGQIVNAAITVHSAIGPGLLEKVYEICFCAELDYRKISYKRQQSVDIKYKSFNFPDILVLDVIVEDLIICELKSVEQLHPVYSAQILSYLKLTGKHLGFLLNFNVPLMKNGIQRFIL